MNKNTLFNEKQTELLIETIGKNAWFAPNPGVRPRGPTLSRRWMFSEIRLFGIEWGHFGFYRRDRGERGENSKKLCALCVLGGEIESTPLKTNEPKLFMQRWKRLHSRLLRWRKHILCEAVSPPG